MNSPTPIETIKVNLLNSSLGNVIVVDIKEELFLEIYGLLRAYNYLITDKDIINKFYPELDLSSYGIYSLFIEVSKSSGEVIRDRILNIINKYLELITVQ